MLHYTKSIVRSLRSATALTAGTAALFLMLNGCGTPDPGVPADEARRDSLDSLTAQCTDTARLNSMAEGYARKQDALGEAVALRQLGKTYRDLNAFGCAISSHQHGLRVAERACDTLEIVAALNNLGTDYRRMGILDEAAKHHVQALTYIMKFSGRQTDRGLKTYVVALNGLGNVYLTTDNLQQADSVLRIALAGEIKLGSMVGQAINYANLGSIKERLGQTDSAWNYYQRSMDFNQKAGSQLGISLCYNHFGDLHTKAGKYAQAIEEYGKSYRLMERRHDRWHWLESCISLAELYIRTGQNAQAHQYLLRADAVADTINSIRHEARIHDLFHKLYYNEGNYREALRNYTLSAAYSDSMLNAANLNRIQNARIALERERRQQDLCKAENHYRSEAQTKNIFLITAILGLVFLAGVAALLAYFLKERRQKTALIKRLLYARERLFTNITHELRTPLTVILGEAETLAGATSCSLQRTTEAGRAIRRQGQSLLALVNELLDIARTRSDVAAPEWRHGEAITYIRMIVDSYQPLAKEKNIFMTFQPRENRVDMDLVPEYLHKILRNLIANAVKFTDDGGLIIIDTALEDNRLHIRVSDNGRGIEQAQLSHLFELFYQADSESHDIGTGVGLALVKQLAQGMDGTIEADSAPGEGSTFTLTIPVSHGNGRWKPLSDEDEPTADAMQTIPADAAPQLRDAGEEGGKAAKVLVVEDNADVAHYIGRQVNHIYKVYYATNGDEGLEKARRILPDIVLTDIMMPGIDGLELCRRIRASELTNHIPIIAITAKTSQDDREEGLRAGANAYLHKPFSRNELLIQIDQMLAMRRVLTEKTEQARHAGGSEKPALSDADREFVSRLTDVVHEQMKLCSFEVNTIASKLCMSRSTLSRRLLSATGDSVTGYTAKVRIAHARKLLRQHPDWTTNEVSLQCGFEDPSYFSRVFKQIEGISPSQYRKNAV